MVTAQPFKILYVCTRNTACSPFAEACTRELVEKADASCDWLIASAGTAATAGDPAAPELVAVAESFSMDVGGHKAAELTGADCESADLVLAMSWDEAAHVWSLVPDSWGKCFTLREFVHWAKQAPSRPSILFPDKRTRMKDRIEQAHAIRRRARADFGFWGGLRPQDLNVTEPDGRGDAAWRAFAQNVRLMATDAVKLLGGP